MSWEPEGDPKVVEKLSERTLEIVELNAEVEDAVLELVVEEASTNAVVVDLAVEEDNSAAGFGEEADTTVERGELLVEDTTAAEGEEHSAVAAAGLVEGIRYCHLAEELLKFALVPG